FNRLLNQKGEIHQGVCIELKHFFSYEELSFSKLATVLILDRIQDPRNLGAIIRTAWLMNVESVFISSRNSVGLTPSVTKAACGGVEHVPIFIKNNLRKCLEELKRKNFWIYALDSQSRRAVWDENLQKRKAFLLGGEDLGIRRNLKNVCDETLSIPQKDKSANYNVSVAVAVVLSEAFRQNGQK
ncbi:MAG: RNA methyltransferase, partial [Oligoflexia bacterium]|nr:RNA methyltransferase [Oligoflexia bacterium]